MANACNPTTFQAEADRSLQVQGQLGLYRELRATQGNREMLSQKTNKKLIGGRGLCTTDRSGGQRTTTWC